MLQSGDTPMCIAISEGKEEMFELIVKKMSPTERYIYISVSVLVALL